MELLAVAGAGTVLLLTVGAGLVAHELSHAAVLYVLGVECDVVIGPGWVGPTRSDASARGTWASVTPRDVSPETSARALRLSAVAPLVLAVPFVAVLAGVVPDPMQADVVALDVLTVGWLACAIPSPQDFSVFWYAERAVAEHTADSLES